MRISIGIIAAPRPVETVGKTLQSLISAGFHHDPITIFAEPGEYKVEDHKEIIPIIKRPETYWKSNDLEPSRRPESLGRFGNFQNFVQTLRDLVVINSGDDAIMIVEDDTVFASNVRIMVKEKIDAGFDGMLSLYTPNIRQFFDIEKVGYRTISREYFFGGLALVFPMELAKKIANVDTRGWPGGRRQEPGIDLFEREASDAWVGFEVRKAGKVIKGWNPSITSHYCPAETPGGNSSRSTGKAHTGPRQAKSFIGESTNAFDYFSVFG